MPIRLLRSDVSSRIAAGEVIERPSSAVKELIENALDAGATRVWVEVRGGGIGYIRVTDDGVGIRAGEVELAFQRFATSKLSEVEDLEAVATLGFRGEALPSIAAVAHIELRTRSSEEESGTRIEVEDGEVRSLTTIGAPVGTTVIVQNLFRNFPARRKFLRSAASELSRIQSVVTHYALAYPDVGFELKPDRGRTFASPGSGDLRESVSAVYGREVATSMLALAPEVEEQDAPAVSGLIGPPSMDRANRTYISLFVNRRWIQDRSLSYAIEQSYHGFMADRRYPIAVVHLSVPHQDVDVNAHPSKAEIRFRNQNRVFAALQRAVRGTLTEHSPVPGVSSRAVTPSTHHAPPSGPTPSAFWPTVPFAGARGHSSGDGSPQPSAAFDGLFAPHDTPTEPSGPAPSPTSRDALPILRVLGQVQNTYVVAEGPDGVYMIDQHAAHERVMFEKVKALFAAASPEVQSLLEPAVVELDEEKMELVRTQSEVISGMGFTLETFGVSSVIVRGVPALVRDSDQSKSLIDVLDLMADGGGFETWEDRAAYSIACHGAIRAGKALSRDEMSELARQLEGCVQPHTCPHGRPTMIHMSSGQLEREFRRT